MKHVNRFKKKFGLKVPNKLRIRSTNFYFHLHFKTVAIYRMTTTGVGLFSIVKANCKLKLSSLTMIP